MLYVKRNEPRREADGQFGGRGAIGFVLYRLWTVFATLVISHLHT